MTTENIQQKKAVIYCRVSTKEQAEEGNSLVTQERNCREYAQKHGYQVAQVFIEEGESAKTAERTELQKLLRHCTKKKEQIKAVIIYKIDRLSRNTDDYSQLRIQLRHYGVEIKSTSEYFENSPAGKFMENIIANVAQFDNDVRTERSVGGMKDAVREGRYVWLAPVGYENQKLNGKSNIVPCEKAKIVRKAFKMMAERKYSIDRIRDLLTISGLTTRSGKPLTRSAFYKMIKNELYCGWIRKFNERHRGNFEPIVSNELFGYVQRVINKKKMPVIYRKQHPDFPLRRFVVHSDGSKLTGAWSKGRNTTYAYYRFNKTHLYWPKAVLEDKFGFFMDKFAFDKSLLKILKQELHRHILDNSDINKLQISSLTIKRNDLKRKQDILVQKNLDGIFSDSIAQEHLSKLDLEILEIDIQLNEADQSKVDIPKIFDFLTRYLESPSSIWKNAPLEVRLELQWFQFPEGVGFDGKQFGTTKISSVFKLKDFFLANQSFKVHHSDYNNEHLKTTKFPPLKPQEPIAWEEIKEELKRLHKVFTKERKSDPLHQWPVWAVPEELSPG